MTGLVTKRTIIYDLESKHPLIPCFIAIAPRRIAHLALATTTQLSAPARAFDVINALTPQNGNMPGTDANAREAIGKSLVGSVSLSAYVHLFTWPWH